MAIPVQCYSVYMHKNKQNGKIYIGVTKQKPEKRFQRGYGYKYSNERFWKDIVHYGWDAFEHNVMFSGLSKYEASRREMELVKKYKSQDPQYGYNQISGGFRPCRPEISEMMKQRKGILNPNYGKQAPAKTREALINYARYGQLGKNNHKARAVLQFDKRGKYIESYPCIADAERALNIDKKSSHICDCCKGKRKSSNGFIWKYEGSVDLSRYQY